MLSSKFRLIFHGFYGDKSTGYKGVNPSRVKQLIKSCENSMLDWINKNTKSNITDFKQYYREGETDKIVVKSEDFQFNNGIMDEGENFFDSLQEGLDDNPFDEN